MPAPFDKSTVSSMLTDLKRHDPHFKVFGAGSHRYELNPPLPVQQIAAFEAKHRVTLRQSPLA